MGGTRTAGEGVRLSRRQAQILEGIGRGNTYRALAEKLAISPATVSYHVGQLQMRLRTPSLPALIGLAIVSGILSSDQFPLEWTGNLVVPSDFVPDGTLPGGILPDSILPDSILPDGLLADD